MAKPTKFATPISIVLSILVIIGIVWGVKTGNPLVVSFLLLPAVIYEVYRTEGESTKWASWAMLLIVIAEIYCIIQKINFSLAKYFDTSTAYFYGYVVPLGEIRVVFPVIMIFLAFVLFFRTNGKYTKWLAILIFASAIAIVYILDPTILKTLLNIGIQRNTYY